MTSLEKLDRLAATGVFAKLSASELAQVAGACELRDFEPGQVVLVKERSLSLVHLPIEGSLLSGTTKLDGIVGAEGVFLNRVLKQDIKAGEAGARTLIISKGKFFTIINECPALALSLIEQFKRTCALYHQSEDER